MAHNARRTKLALKFIAAAVCFCFALTQFGAVSFWKTPCAEASPERRYDCYGTKRNVMETGLPKPLFTDIRSKQQENLKRLSEIFNKPLTAFEIPIPSGTGLSRKNGTEYIAEYANLFDAAVLTDIRNYAGYSVNGKNEILGPEGNPVGAITTFSAKDFIAYLNNNPENGKVRELLKKPSVEKLLQVTREKDAKLNFAELNISVASLEGNNLLVVVDEAPQAKQLTPAASTRKKEVSKVANRGNLKAIRADFKSATRYVYNDAGPYQMVVNDGRGLGAGLDKKFAVVACQNGKVFGVQVYERKKGADGLYQMTDEVIFPDGADIDATIMDKREIGYVQVNLKDGRSVKLNAFSLEPGKDSIQVYTFGKQVAGKMKYPEQITCSYRRNRDGSTSIYKAIYSNNHANRAFGIDKINVTAYDSEGKPAFYYDGAFYESTLNDRAFRKENRRGSYTGATDYWPRSIGGIVYTEFDKEGRPLSGCIVGENGIKGPAVTNEYDKNGELRKGAVVAGQWVMPVRNKKAITPNEAKPIDIENASALAHNPINLKKGLSWDEAVVSFCATPVVDTGLKTAKWATNAIDLPIAGTTWGWQYLKGNPITDKICIPMEGTRNSIDKLSSSIQVAQAEARGDMVRGLYMSPTEARSLRSMDNILYRYAIAAGTTAVNLPLAAYNLALDPIERGKGLADAVPQTRQRIKNGDAGDLADITGEMTGLVFFPKAMEAAGLRAPAQQGLEVSTAWQVARSPWVQMPLMFGASWALGELGERFAGETGKGVGGWLGTFAPYVPEAIYQHKMAGALANVNDYLNNGGNLRKLADARQGQDITYVKVENDGTPQVTIIAAGSFEIAIAKHALQQMLQVSFGSDLNALGLNESDIKGLNRQEALEIIKSALKKIAQECHPDRNEGVSSDAQLAKLKAANSAYSNLKDPYGVINDLKPNPFGKISFGSNKGTQEPPVEVAPAAKPEAAPAEGPTSESRALVPLNKDAELQSRTVPGVALAPAGVQGSPQLSTGTGKVWREKVDYESRERVQGWIDFAQDAQKEITPEALASANALYFLTENLKQGDRVVTFRVGSGIVKYCNTSFLGPSLTDSLIAWRGERLKSLLGEEGISYKAIKRGHNENVVVVSGDVPTDKLNSVTGRLNGDINSLLNGGKIYEIERNKAPPEYGPLLARIGTLKGEGKSFKTDFGTYTSRYGVSEPLPAEFDAEDAILAHNQATKAALMATGSPGEFGKVFNESEFASNVNNAALLQRGFEDAGYDFGNFAPKIRKWDELRRSDEWKALASRVSGGEKAVAAGVDRFIGELDRLPAGVSSIGKGAFESHLELNSVEKWGDTQAAREMASYILARRIAERINVLDYLKDYPLDDSQFSEFLSQLNAYRETGAEPGFITELDPKNPEYTSRREFFRQLIKMMDAGKKFRIVSTDRRGVGAENLVSDYFAIKEMSGKSPAEMMQTALKAGDDVTMRMRQAEVELAKYLQEKGIANGGESVIAYIGGDELILAIPEDAATPENLFAIQEILGARVAVSAPIDSAKVPSDQRPRAAAYSIGYELERAVELLKELEAKGLTDVVLKNTGTAENPVWQFSVKEADGTVHAGIGAVATVTPVATQGAAPAVWTSPLPPIVFELPALTNPEALGWLLYISQNIGNLNDVEIKKTFKYAMTAESPLAILQYMDNFFYRSVLTHPAKMASYQADFNKLIEERCIPLISRLHKSPGVQTALAFEVATIVQSLNLPAKTAEEMVRSIIPAAERLDKNSNEWEIALGSLGIIAESHHQFKERIFRIFDLTEADLKMYKELAEGLINEKREIYGRHQEAGGTVIHKANGEAVEPSPAAKPAAPATKLELHVDTTGIAYATDKKVVDAYMSAPGFLKEMLGVNGSTATITVSGLGRDHNKGVYKVEVELGDGTKEFALDIIHSGSIEDAEEEIANYKKATQADPKGKYISILLGSYEIKGMAPVFLTEFAPGKNIVQWRGDISFDETLKLEKMLVEAYLGFYKDSGKKLIIGGPSPSEAVFHKDQHGNWRCKIVDLGTLYDLTDPATLKKMEPSLHIDMLSRFRLVPSLSDEVLLTSEEFFFMPKKMLFDAVIDVLGVEEGMKFLQEAEREGSFLDPLWDGIKKYLTAQESGSKTITGPTTAPPAKHPVAVAKPLAPKADLPKQTQEERIRRIIQRAGLPDPTQLMVEQSIIPANMVPKSEREYFMTETTSQAKMARRLCPSALHKRRSKHIQRR